MDTDLSSYYPLIGKLCIKCGAVEFELDRFLFAASDLYHERLTCRFRNWPQQASHKLDAFSYVLQNLMKFPPNPNEFGFLDTSELQGGLVRLYEVRNIIFHGTPVTGGGRQRGLDFAKVTRSEKGRSSYSFSPEHVSFSLLEELVKTSDKLILLLDACITGLRKERGGWLEIDLSGSRQIVKDDLAARAGRDIASLLVHRQENGQK